MTVLSGRTIAEYCCGERPMIAPFSGPEKFDWFDKRLSFGLSHCGYDIRLSETGNPITLEALGGFSLAHTLEKFDMPPMVVGVVHDKSTLARLGVAVQNTVIEPGWRGYLTLEITAHSQEVTLIPGMPIAQVLFHRLDREVEGYDGKYQDQKDAPVEAM